MSFACNLFNTEFSFLFKFGVFHLTIGLIISRSLVVCFTRSTSVILLTWFFIFAYVVMWQRWCIVPVCGLFIFFIFVEIV